MSSKIDGNDNDNHDTNDSYFTLFCVALFL